MATYLLITPGKRINRTFKETLATNAASTEVLVTHGAFPTVRLIGFDGAGRSVQYTTSPEADITAGTANWLTWSYGNVVGNAEGRALGAVTGVRLSPTGGAGTWHVVG